MQDVGEGNLAGRFSGMNRWPASSRKMSFGAILPMAEDSAFGERTPGFADVLEMTCVANDVGFEAVWIIDHFVFRNQPDDQFAMPETADERGVWECFTTMAGLASTIFLPVAGWLTERYGWREALVVLAILGIAVNLKFLLALWLSGFFVHERTWIRWLSVIFIIPWAVPAIPSGPRPTGAEMSSNPRTAGGLPGCGGGTPGIGSVLPRLR